MVVIGAFLLAVFALIVWRTYRQNKYDSRDYYESISCDRHGNDIDSDVVKQTKSNNIKLVLDPETREIIWICGNCGHANSCYDMTCANCQSRR